jgi:hypothetical protein
MRIITESMRELSKIIAQTNPNDDPQELFSQVLPVLRRMGINNMVDRNKTELVSGKTKGDDSLYKITLRRDAQITDDEINRLKREDDAFETLQWSNQAMEVYVWAPYRPPAEAETPAEPGAPPTP